MASNTPRIAYIYPLAYLAVVSLALSLGLAFSLAFTTTTSDLFNPFPFLYLPSFFPYSSPP